MVTNLSFTTAVIFLALAMFLRYLFFSGSAYFIFWKKLKDKFAQRKLNFAPFQKNQIKKEILYSFNTTIVYGLVLGALLNKNVVSHTKVYFDVSERGWGYFFLSLVIIFVFHDMYFYLSHRLLHTPFLYRKVHSVHHSTLSPDPWTSYSFHFAEALSLVLFMPLLIMAIPVNFWALNIFGVGTFLFNVVGHLGYEIMPKNYMKFGLHNFMNTATHHSLHHKYPNSNYSLYFNYLDRLFKTNHRKYSTELSNMLKKEVL
ncbi:MAG: sterol desaturase family protein [Oligoflexia bacterium]|nr:sterol desaturase family protein [Oligoflexia bacterium]